MVLFYSSFWFRNCKRFGRQSWLIAAVIITEFLIVVKFDWNTVTKPLPKPIAIFWVLGLLGLVGWTVLKFYILKVRFALGDLVKTIK